MAAAFSHVIFDLDGTILNTLEDLAAAGNHTCETHGWPTFAVDEYRYKVGNGMLLDCSADKAGCHDRTIGNNTISHDSGNTLTYTDEA